VGLSYRGSANLIERLEQDGLLEEVTGQKRNRVYIAKDILTILEAPPE